MASERRLDGGGRELGEAATLAGQDALSQRLVRDICPDCKVPVASDDLMFEEHDVDRAEYEGSTPCRGAGCDSCGGTGYSGRTAVGEFMAVNSEIEALIVAKSASSPIAEAAKRAGMTTIHECGMDKVRAGITTLDEVLRVAGGLGA